jgi:hypothetical protein
MNATGCGQFLRSLVALACVFSLIPGETYAFAATQSASQAQSAAPSKPAAQSTKLPPDQLDSLVAPIALYPDPLLAQVLAASTYPLEIIQLQQWLAQNPNLKDKALADAVAKQPWDASVQALAALPEAVKRLADDISWTTDLGNAFLAQQSEVMDAVQRMRKKAQSKGNLKTSEQQKVETTVIENKETIIIQPSSTQVVYVPTYDPVVVYGPPVYPYPPIYYPPAWYYPAGMAISFGVGVMMGAFWSGGWGWGCGWGGNNNININRNNNFVRNGNGNLGGGNRVSTLPSGGANRPGNGVGGNRPGAGGGVNRPSQLPANGNNWQHNPQHRGGAPYKDRATADRFGGTARGDSLAQRQASARQQISRQGGTLGSNRAAGGGTLGNRTAGSAGVGNRAAGGAGAGNRAGGAGGGALGGGPDRIGSRDLSRTGGGNRDAFGGGTQGFSGANARSSSSRGMSSFGGGGGGFSRGGGGGRGGRR